MTFGQRQICGHPNVAYRTPDSTDRSAERTAVILLVQRRSGNGLVFESGAALENPTIVDAKFLVDKKTRSRGIRSRDKRLVTDCVEINLLVLEAECTLESTHFSVSQFEAAVHSLDVENGTDFLTLEFGVLVIVKRATESNGTQETTINIVLTNEVDTPLFKIDPDVLFFLLMMAFFLLMMAFFLLMMAFFLLMMAFFMMMMTGDAVLAIKATERDA